ncbi:unnamed protein product [Effrenium voratum]|uniref:Hydroxylysine kinase n=1 Tax=Effrenium voratum TaxID=2562239 RepID=A0AA36JHX1_9DINO|nr:unnamed protein product [Effrenium voratum]
MVEGRPALEPLVAQLPELLPSFGLPGTDFTWKELPSFDDRNLLVSVEGRKYVLKAHNTLLPSGSHGRLQAQDRLIQHLQKQALPVPDVLENLGAPSHVRVLSYLEGEVLKTEAPKSLPFLQSVGKWVAKVATSLQTYEDEAMNWTWDWDMKRLPEVVRTKLSFMSDQRRLLAARLCEEYAAHLTPEVVAQLPHSVLHADLNDTNLLFAGEEIVGIIDFGDSIYSCRIFEPAITAGYFSLGQANPLQVLREVLRGYLQQVPWDLSNEEVMAYFHAARGRVLLSVAFAAENSFLEPDNEYLAHTAEPGWRVLEALEDTEKALPELLDVASAVRSER